jgi:hypothetical protein
MRNPNFELTDEGDGEGEGMRDSGRWLRGSAWAIDDGDARDSTEGIGRRLGGYLVESKRLGVARVSHLNPAVIQGSGVAHRTAMRSSWRTHGGLITRQSGRNRSVVTWR